MDGAPLTGEVREGDFLTTNTEAQVVHGRYFPPIVSTFNKGSE